MRRMQFVDIIVFPLFFFVIWKIMRNSGSFKSNKIIVRATDQDSPLGKVMKVADGGYSEGR